MTLISSLDCHGLSQWRMHTLYACSAGPPGCDQALPTQERLDPWPLSVLDFGFVSHLLVLFLLILQLSQ